VVDATTAEWPARATRMWPRHDFAMPGHRAGCGKTQNGKQMSVSRQERETIAVCCRSGIRDTRHRPPPLPHAP